MRIRAHAVLALASLLCALPLCGRASAQTAPPRVVLTIHLGAETFPSNPVLDASIRKALESRADVPIDYFAEYLETDQFPPERETLALADYLRQKYAGRTIDVVIANSDQALKFVLDHRGEFAPHAPIVFAGLTVPDERPRDVGLTGITVGAAYAETLRLALDLQPSVRQVFVVANAGEERPPESIKARLSEFTGRVSISYLDATTVAQLQSEVKAVPQGSVILYIWHHPQTERGNVMYADEVARFVTEVAPVPVYGTSDFYFGTGVVGGVVRRTGETGTRLGEMALSILTGTRPQDMPVENARVVPVVDWRQVKRWSLGARVPASAQILFREPSVWERYKIYIVGAATTVLMQAALIAGLLIQRGRRRAAEQQVRRSQSALRSSYEQVRDLGSRLLNAQEQERSRIARELHDDISQRLAVLNVNLTMLRRMVQGRAESAAAEAATRAHDIATSVHDLSHRLHPARLRVMGLVQALDGLRGEVSAPGVTVLFTHENVPPALTPDLTLCLYRVTQEALQNAVKYSQARTVSVDVRADSGDISLTITDDGVGFDVEAVWGRGLGLISVRERVEAVGGTLQIRSGHAAGTCLEVRVPASHQENPEAVAV